MPNGKRGQSPVLHRAPVWEGAQLSAALHGLGQELFQHRLFSSLCLVCPLARPAGLGRGQGDILSRQLAGFIQSLFYNSEIFSFQSVLHAAPAAWSNYKFKPGRRGQSSA